MEKASSLTLFQPWDGQANLFALKALRLKLVWFYLWFQKDKLYVESSREGWVRVIGVGRGIKRFIDFSHIVSANEYGPFPRHTTLGPKKRARIYRIYVPIAIIDRSREIILSKKAATMILIAK